MDTTFNVQAGNRTIYTTVTNDRCTIAEWIKDVTDFFRTRRTVVFGLDVEWRPNWGRGPQNPPATLQICAGNRCLIIQLIHLDHLPSVLAEFLENPRHLFTGVGIEDDAAKLEDVYGLICENLYDLREVALEKRSGRLSRCPGLKELASVVAGVYLEKPKRVTTSNWDLEYLSDEQVEYACLDAYASCRVGVVLFFDYQWECSSSTCAYIQCQQHVVSPETSDYEESSYYSDTSDDY